MYNENMSDSINKFTTPFTKIIYNISKYLTMVRLHCHTFYTVSKLIPAILTAIKNIKET